LRHNIFKSLVASREIRTVAKSAIVVAFVLCLAFAARAQNELKAAARAELNGSPQPGHVCTSSAYVGALPTVIMTPADRQACGSRS